MSVLTACQNAATEMGLTAPSAVYASTEKFATELGSLAIESAQYIAKYHDWRKFVLLNTFNGDSATNDFSMPGDYDRMVVDGKVLRSSTITPIEMVQDLNDWLYRRMHNISSAIGEAIILGGYMQIYPTLSANDSVKFYYCSNLIIADNASVKKIEFTADTDTFLLSERLLKLALKWKWRAMKKLDSADEQEEFEIALAQEVARDKGSRVIGVGTPRWPSDVNIAYPGIISA